MRVALIAFLALGACSHAPPDEPPPPQLPQRAGVDETVAARAEGVRFRGEGDGFVLDILDQEMRLKFTQTGETHVFPTPEPRYPRWNGSSYDTHNGEHGLYVEIRDDRPCEPGVPAIRVRFGAQGEGQQLTGCARRF